MTARTLLRGAQIIDGTGAGAAVGDVVVSEGRIADVGSGLDGDDEVDLSGRWLLPGLIDCHTHVMVSTIDMLRAIQTPFSLNFYLAAANLRRTLEAGITSIRDAGGADLGVKRAVEQELIAGPRLTITVSILSQTGGHGDHVYPSGFDVPFLGPHPGRPDGVCDGDAGVVRKVREVLRAGADVIKVCASGGVLSTADEPGASQFLLSELETIVAEAAASQRTVMAHAQAVTGIKNAVRAGVASIEHGIFLDDEAIGMMLERGVFLVPTLIAPMGVLDAPEGVPEAAVRKAGEVVEIHRASISRAVEAGVRIAMGTDCGVVPHGRNASELVEMVGVGMTPMAAIEASTRVAAENLGVAHRRGTIEPGKDADLVALAGDPLEDVQVFADPASVVGVWQVGRQVRVRHG